MRQLKTLIISNLTINRIHNLIHVTGTSEFIEVFATTLRLKTYSTSPLNFTAHNFTMPSAKVEVPTALESTLMSAILERYDGPLNVRHTLPPSHRCSQHQHGYASEFLLTVLHMELNADTVF